MISAPPPAQYREYWIHNGGAFERGIEVRKLRQICNIYIIGMVCLIEVTKDWRDVEQKDTIWNATASWRDQRRLQVSNNTSRNKTGEFQVGGRQ